MKDLIIKGARTHNLKNIDVVIPRDKLVVITGMSGSGKSSLAFDTIYAEGQRRYVESLSAYARQFLDRMDKPDVDTIEGLSPAVSVEQKAASHNPRSTVGTVTEIYDYLRILFARVGRPHCYKCGRAIERQTVSQIVERLVKSGAGQNVYLLAPVVEARKGEHVKVLERLRQQGFARVKINGTLYELSEEIELDKKRKSQIDLVVDRFKITAENRQRLADSLETALRVGDGVARVEFLDTERKVARAELLSVNNACVHCGISYPKIEPQMFSFNSPQGACPECDGLGELMFVSEDLVVPDHDRSINQGAIVPWFGKKTNYYQSLLEAAAHKFGFGLDVPYKKLPGVVKKILFDGSSEFLKVHTGRFSYDGFFEGIKNNLMRRYKETESDWMRDEIVKYMSYQDCPLCHGHRLKQESLFIKVGDSSIADLTSYSIARLKDFLDAVNLTDKEREIARLLIKEIHARLEFLANVGLNYLTLHRKSHTLSGGEAQRIRLATQIGAALVGVIYVLDEPSVGLHQRDNDRLIATLKNLRDLGNTVIVVEHDEDAIRQSDYVLDLGPRAGVHGGEVIYAGPPGGIQKAARSMTGAYLAGEKTIAVPKMRRAGNLLMLRLNRARLNNLKDLTMTFPLGKLICVTGVSGSGKSTLINDTLLPLLQHRLLKTKITLPRDTTLGPTEMIDKVINIDQSPIGRTPRSNPATYTGLFTHIRELFAQLLESKARGYGPGRFSFNVKGGRCENCEGDGLIRIEMHFLPDVFVRCDVCGGKRFNAETLDILYKGKTIADVLKMSVDEACEFFKNMPPIRRKCETLARVGLGYIEIGQAATTLSGGEAQRIKLSRELSKRPTGKTLYILDEPTTGLHFEDIHFLLTVLAELVDAGNTVIVIEHNMHVIKTADHIIDLGPEGGEGGGWIVAQGTPEELAGADVSLTGRYLKAYLKTPRSAT